MATLGPMAQLLLSLHPPCPALTSTKSG
ncbi:MAG: hypothetical protein JWL64_2266, partial [Frankiales bacterium]|nr:hypothetical protein [Frankiales bacterium]